MSFFVFTHGNKPKESTMTEVTVKVDNNNPDTVTVNGVEYERKVPVLTLEERVIAELDSLYAEELEFCISEDDRLINIGRRLTTFHSYGNKRDSMLHICLNARQILIRKGRKVEMVGNYYSAHTQKALPLKIAQHLAEYHCQPSTFRIANIYYASLRWLMNDLESNQK